MSSGEVVRGYTTRPNKIAESNRSRPSPGYGFARRDRRSGQEPLTSLFRAAPLGIRTSTFVPLRGRESTLT